MIWWKRKKSSHPWILKREFHSLTKSGIYHSIRNPPIITVAFSYIFFRNHMLGTLDFTGSKHWATFNFPSSTALCCIFHIYMLLTHCFWTKKVRSASKGWVGYKHDHRLLSQETKGTQRNKFPSCSISHTKSAWQPYH